MVGYMKMFIAGCQRISGTSKKTGGAYDFSRLLVLSEISNRSGDGYSVQASGFECQEIAVDPGALSQFKSLKFPVYVDVVTEARPGAGGKGFEVWVVGVKGSSVPSAA